jgi:hypothetical protein
MQRLADGFRRLDYKSRHSAPARTRRKRQLSPVAAGVVIAIHFSLSDQLATLRRTFDERLIALETGLSDPHQGPSIESLILDLARVAAEEAEAAARDVIRRVRREAAEQTASATADAEETQALLQAERGRTERLRAEIATLTEQLSTANNSRHETDAGKQRELDQKQHELQELKAKVEELKLALDETSHTAAKNAESLAKELERVNVAMRERDFFAQQRDTLTAERDRLIVERDAIAAARDAMTAERDTVLRQRDTSAADHGTLTTERDSAIADRDAALEEREVLASERDALITERDRLVAERDEFVRSHDALALQRDTLSHERDEIREERDREIRKLREELTKASAAPAPPAPAAPPATPKPSAIEHAMSELQDMTSRHSPKAPKKQAVIEHALTELQEGMSSGGSQTSKKKSASAKVYSAVRQDPRQAFSNALGVQIDGEAALLVDLSVGGAQVLSCSALKPAKNVKMLLPSSDQPVLCRGRIVWARLEPTMPGKPIRYRAGMTFTGADQAAVQTFMTRHASRPSR